MQSCRHISRCFVCPATIWVTCSEVRLTRLLPGVVQAAVLEVKEADVRMEAAAAAAAAAPPVLEIETTIAAEPPAAAAVGPAPANLPPGTAPAAAFAEIEAAVEVEAPLPTPAGGTSSHFAALCGQLHVCSIWQMHRSPRDISEEGV